MTTERQERYRGERERDPHLSRRQNLKHKYGMTLEDYEAKLASQGGVCAICGNPPKKRALAVDHDHNCCSTTRESGRTCGECVRGLLCTLCNTRLQAVEDAEYLKKLQEYIEEWR